MKTIKLNKKVRSMNRINKLKFNRKEIQLINEACQWWVEELKEDSTFENPNNKKYYALLNTIDKLKHALDYETI